MRFSKVLDCFAAIGAAYLLFAPLESASAQTAAGTIMPSVEWEKRINAADALSRNDAGLVGDSIDPRMGALSFEHTDINLPGNSRLDVAIRRRRELGDYYKPDGAFDFGDWQLLTPRIKVTIPVGANWSPNRCSGSFSTSLPPEAVLSGGPYFGEIYSVDHVLNNEYSNGVILDIPGSGSQQLLDSPVGPHWPAGTTKVTGDGWHLSCIANIGAANGGGEGFYATAPNGDRFRLDRLLFRDAPPLGSIPYNAGWMNRRHALMLATEVTDVSGNWVRYAYDASGRLTSIQSNDGRQINVAYSGSSGLISSIIANPNTAEQRVWAYQYGESLVPVLDSSITVSHPNTLKKVILPDGRSWTFNLSGMSVPPPIAGASCDNLGPQTVDVTHPDGVTGTFTLSQRSHRIWNLAFTVPGVCYGDPPHRTDTPIHYLSFFDAMSVTQKVISGPGIPAATWTYAYESDKSKVQEAVDQRTNWTRMTDPTGAVTTYFHRWENEPLGGKLIRQEVRQGSLTSAPIEIADFTYSQETSVGSTFMVVVSANDLLRLTARTSNRGAVINRLGDTFETLNSYNADFTASGYSFGFPVRFEEWGSTAGGIANKRITDTAYVHNKTKWVMGLPSTVTRSGKLFDSYTYDTLGRVLTKSEFGALRQTFTYNADGTVATFKDSHNHTYTLSGWKRGKPQSVARPDGTTFLRVVDNNGWVTSETDGRALTTGFTYNTMGWLTGVTPPSPFNATTVAYSGLGTGVMETRTRGAKKTTISYDGMLRPTRVKTEATDGSATTSYVDTAYDIFGRTTFQSWPSAAAGSLAGVTSSYDALSRPTRVEETVFPNFATRTAYQSGGVTVVTQETELGDAPVTMTARAFGDPNEAEPMSIVDAMGTTTTFARDIYGNVTTLAQSGTQNGFTASVTRQFWYDNSLRLCRHRAPEFGDEVFLYDSEDQLTQSGRGQAAATGCVTSIGTAIRVTRGYDTLHRETSLAFPAGTPGVTRSYDGNGNATNVTRAGGAAWTYTYTALDALATEQLVIDGRTYAIGHGYNANGDLTTRSNGHSGVTLNFNPDAYGQPRQIAEGSTGYVTGVSYHANGLIAAANYANGQVLTQTLDARSKPYEMKTAKAGGDTAVWLTYLYNKRGLIDAVTDSAVAGENRSFDYDKNGRLVSSTGPWGAGTYVYDALGNIRTRNDGSETATIAYATNNRVTSATVNGAVRNFTYDARGNVTNNGQTGFAYDFANQPTALTGTGAAAYVYDGNLKRVKEVRAGKTIYTVYSRVTGGLIYRDEVTDAIKTDYVNAGGAAIRLIKTGTGSAVPDYSHFDAQGSVVADTRTQGVVLWRESYEPFGRSRINPAANADDTGYTGHLRDSASGLQYMQARYYDPLIGRFLSTDPIGYQDQLNLYAYVANDPVNLVDPNGEIAIYFTAQIQLQVGRFGGRLSLSAGVDTTKRTAFGVISSGGSSDPISPGDAVGVQIGAGAGVGVAESSDFVMQEATTVDVDVIAGSVSVSSNDPLIDEVRGPSDPTDDGSTGSGRDTKVRAVEITVGPGVGASQTTTKPILKGEIGLPGSKQQPPPDPCAGNKDACGS